MRFIDLDLESELNLEQKLEVTNWERRACWGTIGNSHVVTHAEINYEKLNSFNSLNPL